MLRTFSLLVSIAVVLTACAPSEQGAVSDAPLVKYSYEGAPFTVFTGARPPWNTESRVTGYFIAPEIPPNTTVDYLDPDIEYPFVNLPKEFLFSDGARSIDQNKVVDVTKNTGDRLDWHTQEVRAFSVSTDSDGNIRSWDMLFVHDVRRNTFLTAHNGGIYGQDLVEVDATHFGCVATEKCTANANYASQGAVLPDVQQAGTWTRELVEIASTGGEE